MTIRPLTNVTYELVLITTDGAELKEEFTMSYDSELYDDDQTSVDSLFINMRMEDMKEKYGNDVLLLEFAISREKQVIN